MALPTHIPDRPPAGRPTVLFVDDEERILRSLRMMFARDYKVLSTTSGHEAIDLLRGERVHALVSDQRMPIMPGVELLRQARQVSPNTMRLLLTGYSDFESVAGSINEGEIFRFVSKPWNADEFRATVAKAVDIAQQLELPEVPVARAGGASGEEGILVIDDDPGTVDLIRSVVEAHQPGRHRVDWAADVETVLRVLEEREIAVVVSEVRLGGEDITELIKSLKRHQPHIVALALTGYQDSAMLVHLINQAQIHRYMLKPVRPNTTLRAIESGLERHRALKSSPRLTSRHQVEVMPSTTAHSAVAKRILGFFRNLAPRPN